MSAVLTRLSRQVATSARGALQSSYQNQQHIAVGRVLLTTSSQSDAKNDTTLRKPASRSGPPARLKSQSSETPSVPEQQRWTEVVDKPSGQVYYWNEATGNDGVELS